MDVDEMILPDLCLRRVLNFCHSLKAFQNIRLVCNEYYNILTLPKEILENYRRFDFLVHIGDIDDHRIDVSEMLHVLLKNNTSLLTIRWYIRMFGVIEEDVTDLSCVTSVDIVRLFRNIYEFTPHFVKKTKFLDFPCKQHSLEYMKYIFDELKVHVLFDHKIAWFYICCYGDDIEKITYIKNRFNISIDRFTRERFIFCLYMYGSERMKEWAKINFNIKQYEFDEYDMF